MERTFLEWIIFLLQEYGTLFFKGTLTTLWISITGTFIGYLIGFAIGVIRTIPINEEQSMGYRAVVNIVKKVVQIYVVVFRGTPMIVQAMVVYYGASQAFGIDIEPLTAAVIVLSLNTGGYAAEIVRGGIMSIDNGQIEGAKALGMTHVALMLHVVLPQALRNISPQLANLFVTNIKDTSVLNVISVTELFFVTKSAAGTYFRFFEAYTITAMIYLILTILINKLLDILEHKLDGKSDYDLVSEEELKKRMEGIIYEWHKGAKIRKNTNYRNQTSQKAFWRP